MKVFIRVCSWLFSSLLVLTACQNPVKWEYIYVKDGDILISSNAGQKRTSISSIGSVSNITIDQEAGRLYYSQQREENLYIFYKELNNLLDSGNLLLSVTCDSKPLFGSNRNHFNGLFKNKDGQLCFWCGLSAEFQHIPLWNNLVTIDPTNLETKQYSRWRGKEYQKRSESKKAHYPYQIEMQNRIFQGRKTYELYVTDSLAENGYYRLTDNKGKIATIEDEHRQYILKEAKMGYECSPDGKSVLVHVPLGYDPEGIVYGRSELISSDGAFRELLSGGFLENYQWAENEMVFFQNGTLQVYQPDFEKQEFSLTIIDEGKITDFENIKF